MCNPVDVGPNAIACARESDELTYVAAVRDYCAVAKGLDRLAAETRAIITEEYEMRMAYDTLDQEVERLKVCRARLREELRGIREQRTCRMQQLSLQRSVLQEKEVVMGMTHRASHWSPKAQPASHMRGTRAPRATPLDRSDASTNADAQPTQTRTATAEATKIAKGVGSNKRKRKAHEATSLLVLPEPQPLMSVMVERNDVLVTRSDNVHSSGRSIVHADMPAMLKNELEAYMQSFRCDGAVDEYGQRVYNGVTVFDDCVHRDGAKPCYVAKGVDRFGYPFGDILCGDSEVAAMVVVARGVDARLGRRATACAVYAWMHAMRNDDGAVRIWLDRVSDAISHTPVEWERQKARLATGATTSRQQ